MISRGGCLNLECAVLDRERRGVCAGAPSQRAPVATTSRQALMIDDPEGRGEHRRYAERWCMVGGCDRRAAMLVAARRVRRWRGMTGAHGIATRRCGFLEHDRYFLWAQVGGHRKLLKQQPDQRNQREPMAMADPAVFHGESVDPRKAARVHPSGENCVGRASG
jgi:hypothetical protein